MSVTVIHPCRNKPLLPDLLIFLSFPSFSSLFSSSPTSSYMIAIVLGHVEVEFPYISDTGTHTPESCIFSQMLNIVSFLVALTIYVRYKHVEQYYRDSNLTIESESILKLNRRALFVGMASSFGLSIVANFQETNVFRGKERSESVTRSVMKHLD